MDAPEGIGATEDEVVKLEQTIYGLVQSARQFWKKLRDVLKGIGFKGGNIDPCLLFYRVESRSLYNLATHKLNVGYSVVV